MNLLAIRKNGKERGLKIDLSHSPLMSKAFIRSTHS
jgi:hypothetical protein